LISLKKHVILPYVFIIKPVMTINLINGKVYGVYLLSFKPQKWRCNLLGYNFGVICVKPSLILFAPQKSKQKALPTASSPTDSQKRANKPLKTENSLRSDSSVFLT